jgi:two-component system CheB/CheR fusion protein
MLSRRPLPDQGTPRVVAIGASAGGLDAFQKLIKHLPVDTGMAFVLLSHILRGSKSLLPELLAKSTRMNVVQVKGDTKIEANTVYVLPPDQFMEFKNHMLHLVPRPKSPVNSAINYFLFSLANTHHGNGAIGIVLSGRGADGAEGIKELKEKRGGLTMAQSPESAGFRSMPQNAIQIDHVDYVLSPEEIAAKLVEMSADQSNGSTAETKVLWVRKPEN